MKLEDFFDESPFTLMADEASAKHWAGRPAVLKSIDKIIRRLLRRDESSFDIVWADLGAGKSHTLYYLASRLSDDTNKRICVIVEMPEQIKNFRDLYQRIVQKLPFDQLANYVLRSGTVDVENLDRAARAIVHGTPEDRELAIQWLIAERPDLRRLKQSTGITSRIESDATATDVLSSLISCLSANDIRFCLMIDEFQRIGKLAESSRSKVTSSLRSTLSKNPRNFSVIVSIFSKIEKTAMSFIPDELLTLMGMSRPVMLPEMNETEAIDFVRERMKAFRPLNYDGEEFAPIGEMAVRRAIETIAQSSHHSLIPRTILQAISLLYDEVPDNLSPLTSEEVDDALMTLQAAS